MDRPGLRQHFPRLVPFETDLSRFHDLVEPDIFAPKILLGLLAGLSPFSQQRPIDIHKFLLVIKF
jgi:hypothetical protein